MNKFFKRLLESPIIIFLTLVDLIWSVLEKVFDQLTHKVKIEYMLSHIDWRHTYDLLIRVGLTILLWLFYKDYVAYKKKKDVDFVALKKKQDAEYLKLKNKIIILTKIMHDADAVLTDLFIEGRDRQDVALNLIVKSLNKLGDMSIHVKAEDPEITKYKDKVNDKMDEEQDPLYKILNEWDDD
jgi:hypothetical protein